MVSLARSHEGRERRLIPTDNTDDLQDDDEDHDIFVAYSRYDRLKQCAPKSFAYPSD